ncbi:hypothetical protein CERZMDRAFT_93563 [Cercospora zeae-maydis SCOH1-5]|uniref:BTB domain-containing protein n=1 Tax=Cercospora zeae-maydis SCOH1-5 TaxID=717836 RepID=A0A6A6FS48_9PEZI|nr:hypothetical protein CERZMDRAFT_93563 [Cercospora zeae-maydis SCOH1-5]
MARGKTFSNPYLAADYADLEIHCDGATFFAHRAAACARSKVLEAESKAGLASEGKTVFEHQVFDAVTIDCLLQYIYTDGYKLPRADDQEAGEAGAPISVEGEEGCDIYELAAHVYVYAAADLYDINPLKALAATKFIDAAKPVKENDKSSFLDLVARIAKHTMPGEESVLRTKVLKMALQQKKQLLQDEAFVELLFGRKDPDDFVPRCICGAIVEYEAAAIRERTGHQSEMETSKIELGSLQADRDEIRQKLSCEQRELKNFRSTCEQALRTRDAALAELATLRKDHDTARQQLSDNELQLSDVRSQLSAANTRVRGAQIVLDKKIQSFDRIRSCRHCGESPFDYTIDEDQNARCSACSTRHFSRM